MSTQRAGATTYRQTQTVDIESRVEGPRFARGGRTLGFWCLGFAAWCLGCEPEPREPTRLSEWSVAESEPESSGCAVAEPEGPPGATPPVVLEPAPVYCDFVAVPVATLEGSLDGTLPEPGQRVVMTSDGRYFTTSRYGHQVLEWTGDGRFVRAVGAPGEGPGEFVPLGGLILFLGPRDSLFVLDGGQRWTVFDANLNYRRTFRGRFNGRNSQTLHIVEGRGILTTADILGKRPEAAGSFHWMKLDGSPGGSFGPPREVEGLGVGRLERSSALDGGGLWVAPPNGARRGLFLERWTLDGHPTRVLERRVSWLPPDGYPEAPGAYPLPEYDMVHVDADGFIWIGMAVRDPRWRLMAAGEREALTKELYDGRLEVIDPEHGRVVASYRYDGPPEMPPFERFLGAGRHSYRILHDSLGLRSIEILDIHLVDGGTS